LKPTVASQSWVFDFLQAFESYMRILKENMRNRSGIRSKSVKTRFGPETRFEIATVGPVPNRGPVENDLEQLKARLTRPLLATVTEPELSTALQRAANEAASAAWFTPFPLLFFPTLLEEKAAIAKRQQERQREIRQQTQGLLEEAISE
jgi:hypothetical protein